MKCNVLTVFYIKENFKAGKGLGLPCQRRYSANLLF